MSKIRYFVRRSFITVFLIYLVATGLFFMFRFMPGDYTSILIQAGADQATIASLKAQWGLDEPLYVQYYRYLANMLTGEAGQSFRLNQPVIDVVKTRILNSFILVAPAITFAYIVGAFAGTYIGTNRGSRSERYWVIIVIFLGTMPVFFTGIIAIHFLATTLNFFPASGMTSPTLEAPESTLGIYGTQDFWHHFVLPFSVIVARYLFSPSLIMRNSIVETSGQDFIQFHRLKGLSKRVEMRHLMKHALFPVITLYPVSMTRALGGMVLVEVVFNWPGIGNLLVTSVLFRDYPVVQFVFLLVAIWIIISNYIIDIIYGVLDPRVTLENSSS